jgi:hypothetical protein
MAIKYHDSSLLPVSILTTFIITLTTFPFNSPGSRPG